MAHAHRTDQCRVCNKVLRTCRCIGPKDIWWTTCSVCLAKSATPQPKTIRVRIAVAVRCEHPSPVGFVGWSHATCTIAGRERQAAEWCRHCGALGVWSEDGDRMEWFLPGALAEMPDCSACAPECGPLAGADVSPDPGRAGEALRGGNDGVSGKVGFGWSEALQRLRDGKRVRAAEWPEDGSRRIWLGESGTFWLDDLERFGGSVPFSPTVHELDGLWFEVEMPPLDLKIEVMK